MNIVNKKIRQEIVTVTINSGAGLEVPLGVIENLRRVPHIIKIEAFHSGQISNAPLGEPVVDFNTFQKSFLILKDIDSNELKTIPLISLSKNVNGTTIEPVHLPTIDPTKSIIRMANGTVVPIGQVFLFSITYEKA